MARTVMKMVVAVAAALAVAPDGAAAEYHVYTCKTPGGLSAPADGWEAFGAHLGAVSNTCTEPGSGRRELYVVGTDSSNPGHLAGFRFNAPANTKIGRLSFDRVLLRNDGDGAFAAWTAWLGTNQPAITGAFDSCGAGCPGKGFALAPDPNPIADSGPLVDASSAYVMAGCVGSGSCPSSTQQSSRYASVSVRGADIELVDTAPPTATSVSGALASAGAHRGVETAAFDAVDQGGGLYYTLLELKAPGSDKWVTVSKALVDDNQGKCVELDHRVETDNEFAHRVPCALSASDAVTLDTTRHKDGAYELRVLVEDAAGNLGAILPERPFHIDNVPPPINNVAPTATGLARIGRTVSSTQGTWTGEDISYARRWQRCPETGDESCVDIAGATAADHIVTSEDVGHALRVVVSATNEEGTTSVASARTNVVLPPPANSIAPTIDGVAKVGQSLTAVRGTWTGDDLSFAHQWQRCESEDASCVGIAGATAPTYLVTRNDVGHSLRVVITATNPEGSAAATSTRTAAVLPPPTNTQAPQVNGTPKVGQTLSGTRGTWQGDENVYAYEWQRCNGSEATCKPIADATTTSYKLVAADEERKLRLVVSATNAGGTVVAASPMTADVEPPGGGGGGTTGPAGPGAGGGSGPGSTPTPSGTPNGVTASAKALLTFSGPARLRLRYGRSGVTTLTLRDENGRAISGAQIAVLQRLAVIGAPFTTAQSAITTDADGRFRFVIPPGPSRVLRFAYSAVAGGPAVAVRDLVVRVRSKSTLRTDRAKLRNGQRVAFRGRLRGGHIPKGGVVVELQARVPGRWQTFRSTRTNAVGKWRSNYRFTSTTKATTYRFRAKVRGDSGYPYDGSTSKVTSVRVTP